MEVTAKPALPQPSMTAAIKKKPYKDLGFHLGLGEGNREVFQGFGSENFYRVEDSSFVG